MVLCGICSESAWFQSQLLPVLQDHEAQVGSPAPCPSVVAGEGEQAGALAQGQPERSSVRGAGSSEGHVGESKPQ